MSARETYVPKINYSMRSANAKVTKEILEKECGPEGLVKRLTNTWPNSPENQKNWQSAKNAAVSECAKFEKRKGGNTASQPDVQYLLGLSEWAKAIAAAERSRPSSPANMDNAGSVAQSNTNSMASDPGSRSTSPVSFEGGRRTQRKSRTQRKRKSRTQRKRKQTRKQTRQ